jgi:hypothetical protein
MEAPERSSNKLLLLILSQSRSCPKQVFVIASVAICEIPEVAQEADDGVD